MKKLLLTLTIMILCIFSFQRNVEAVPPQFNMINNIIPAFPEAYFTDYCNSLTFNITFNENITISSIKWELFRGDGTNLGVWNNVSSISVPRSYFPSDYTRDSTVLSLVLTVQGSGADGKVNIETYRWNISYLNTPDPQGVKTDKWLGIYNPYISKTDIDAGSTQILHADYYNSIPFSQWGPYQVQIDEMRIPGEWKQVGYIETNDPVHTMINNVNKYSMIFEATSFTTTTFNASGVVVPATIYVNGGLRQASETSFSYVDFNIGPDYLTHYDSSFFALSGMQDTIFVRDSNSDDELYYWDPLLAQNTCGASFTYIVPNDEESLLAIGMQRFSGSDSPDHYIRYIGEKRWGIEKATSKAVPPIDYLSCNTPYQLGNGVTVDLKTGDAKIGETDLVLPQLGGIDFRLKRVFSSRANMMSDWGMYIFGTFHSEAGSSLGYGNGGMYGGPWGMSFPSVNGLKVDSVSQSILTEPMPGWSFDLPRITPYYVYCDGRLYPNCLEVERRRVGNYAHYYWAQGCEKKGDSYYYHDGNFRLTTKSDDSVTLTKADGTSYIFPCQKNDILGGWDYSPLAEIIDKSGNHITITYGDQSATIIDTVGRKIEVTSNGIKVDGNQILTYKVQYDGDFSDWNWDSTNQIVTYRVTDALGRSDEMVMGCDYLELTSATGEITSLKFAPLTNQDNLHDDEFGLYLVSGTSRGRNLELNYQLQHYTFNVSYNTSKLSEDIITSANIIDGGEQLTASFNYDALNMDYYGSPAMYQISCPGASSLIDNNNSYLFTYSKQEIPYSGNHQPLNNQFSQVSNISATGVSSYTRTFAYDPNFLLESENGPDGTIQYNNIIIDNENTYFVGISSITQGILTTNYGYDGKGNLTSITHGDVPPIQYTYDANGNITQITEPKGNTTNITYDETYRLYPITVSSGDRTANFSYYTLFGWLKSKTVGPYVTEYTYDSVGRVSSVINSAGTFNIQYDDTALTATITDYDGKQSVVGYDALGRLANMTSKDNLGAVMSHINYVYDPQHDLRISAITQDGVGTQTYVYNDVNNTQTITDLNGNSTIIQHDVLGRPTKETTSIVGGGNNPGIEIKTYTYQNGLLTGVTDSDKSMQFTYNNRGLITNVAYNDGKSEIINYDNNDNPQMFHDRGGRIYNFEINQYDEVTKIKQNDAIVTSYNYDNLGRVTTITGQNISYQNHYDNKGFLTHTEQTIMGRFYDLVYGYGVHDRLTSLTINNDQGQLLTQFGYDYTYPNTSVSAWVNGHLLPFVTATTGSNGMIISKLLGNGLKLKYNYDNHLRLSNRTLANGDFLPFQSHTYGYNNGGEISTLDGQQFSYDSLNQLTNVTGGLPNEIQNIAYEYNKYGNRTKITKDNNVTNYIYDINTGLLNQAGICVYIYNADGSRATKTKGSDQWAYNYNQYGQLLSVTLNNNVVGSYAYDPSGWRIWKQENGKTSIFIRKDNRVIYQEDFNGTGINANSIPVSKRSFIYLGKELVGTVLNGSETRYYINDHLGTSELIANSSGNVISQIKHTPFGDLIQVQTGTDTSDNSDDYFFTGKELDATGLYYFGGRYYDPEIGQFISEDPSKDGNNWYNYCTNNPISRIDPDGRSWTNPGWDLLTNIVKSVNDLGSKISNWVESNVIVHSPAGNFYEAATGKSISLGEVLSDKERKKKDDRFGELLASGIIAMSCGDLETPVFRGGSSFKIKPSEIKIDAETGFVKTTHGVSVNVDPSKVSKFGGAYRIDRLPEGLTVIQRGADIGHYEIVPSKPMSKEEFQSLLDQISTIIGK